MRIHFPDKKDGMKKFTQRLSKKLGEKLKVETLKSNQFEIISKINAKIEKLKKVKYSRSFKKSIIDELVLIVSLWRQLFYERQKEIGKIVDDEDEESKENKLNRYNIILLKLTPKEIKRWKRDKHERADFIKKVKNSKKYYAKFFVAKTRLDRFWKKWNRKYRALNSVPSENGEYLNRQNLETNVDNKIEKNDSTLLKLIQIHQKARKFYVKQYLLLNKDLQVFENIDSKSLEKIDRNYQNYEKSSVAKRQAIRETRRWELFVATIVGALIPTILDLLPKIYNLILEFLTSKRKNLKAEPQKAPPTNPRSHNPSREE